MKLKLLLAGISLLASLLLLEVLIRLFLPVYDPSGHVEFRLNAEGVPLGIPGFVGRQWKNTGDYHVPVRINSLGFRDAKDLRESTAEDVFVVGDSFSFGHGVSEDERYSNRLEQLLGVRVYNIAIPADFDGYEKLLQYAREHGAEICRLIVGVCMENDLRDYRQRATPAEQLSWPVRKLGWAKAVLTGRSAAYNAVTSFVHRSDAFRAAAVAGGLIDDNIAGMSHNRFPEDVLDTCVDRLRELTAETEATIVVIPSRGLWAGEHQEQERRVHDAFVDRLSRHFAHIVDLRPAFEAEGDPLQYHFRRDGHWNARGHERAAKIIADSWKR